MKKIVILGGGTGLPAILRGIKYIDNIDISAIVNVSDSGGSTGILSSRFDIPAVGDLRRVIASLSKNRENLEKSMEYRISGTGTDLDGHAIGNLIIASQILMKKNFSQGIEATTKMLNVSGTVIPVSNEFNDLHAELEDGTIVVGENNIGHSNQPIKTVFYKNGVASNHAVKAIKNADYIIFGIGSLYTSLIANLIYPSIQQAIKETQSKIIYFANAFTQHGETDNMTLGDHIKAIEKHTFKDIIDEVIVPNTKISHDTIKSYQDTHQELLKNDLASFQSFDLLIEVDKNVVRHGETKIKKCIEKLIS